MSVHFVRIRAKSALWAKPRARFVARPAKGCPGGMLVQWYVCLSASASACVVLQEWGIILEKHFCDGTLAKHIARYKYIIIKTERKCEVPVPMAMPRPTIGETEHAGRDVHQEHRKQALGVQHCSILMQHNISISWLFIEPSLKSGLQLSQSCVEILNPILSA